MINLHKNTGQQAWFITGTDTDVGKTWATLAIIHVLKTKYTHVAGMKPIATGCYYQGNNLRNSDAEQILKLTGLTTPYQWVNPYAFAPPIAPHLAAEELGQTIELDNIVDNYQRLSAQSEAIVVEGVGGWRVPLNESQSLKDIVLALNLPVILVIGLRLGCINHALLTAETIMRDGCHLFGWIANSINPDFNSEGSINTLSKNLPVPLLAHFPYLKQQNIVKLAQTFKSDIFNL
ncbi:MAG: dethiobiotin synthase [Thiomargarita sp.]|nr:dethiobiotin synthase [Thiomargarita sp.]